MATKIVNLCDPHMAADVEVPGTPVEVTIGRAAYQLDLCAEDYDTYVKPLFALMTEHGRKVAAGGAVATAAKPPGPAEPCLLCPGSKPFGSRIGFATHVRRAHGLSVHAYNVKLGLAEPSAYVCCLCPEPKDLGTPTGLSSHGRSVHGLGKGKFVPANEAAKAEREAGETAGAAPQARRKR